MRLIGTHYRHFEWARPADDVIKLFLEEIWKILISPKLKQLDLAILKVINSFRE